MIYNSYYDIIWLQDIENLSFVKNVNEPYTTVCWIHIIWS